VVLSDGLLVIWCIVDYGSEAFLGIGCKGVRERSELDSLSVHALCWCWGVEFYCFLLLEFDGVDLARCGEVRWIILIILVWIE